MAGTNSKIDLPLSCTLVCLRKSNRRSSLLHVREWRSRLNFKSSRSFFISSLSFSNCIERSTFSMFCSKFRFNSWFFKSENRKLKLFIFFAMQLT